MTVACPDCRSVFRIDPAKVPAGGARARCSVCGGVVAIAGGTLSVTSTPSSPTPALPPPVEAPRPPSAATPAPTPPVQATAPAAGAAGAGGEAAPARRPINPFLQADPGQRARRLARALVSDLVAYNPQKREEGLKLGTLRQLFREEIKKSYEEYVEQVGRDLAESTPHFQEALNDILGAGRKLF